ncbi:MAG: hypothetical protein HY773_01950 [Candidatus Terrybacteria bacterium]|nr:hypothetical protein [Candidatus Terrybacteria bacterium]
MKAEYKQEWDMYLKKEIAEITPFLTELGFVLDVEQPHVGGERYLMSGRKIILIGYRKSDGKKAIIKISSDPLEKNEIERERNLREILLNLNFSYKTFLFPEELVFARRGKYVIYATAYIEQENPFLGRSLEEQFFLALRIFEAQEGFHATASSHIKKIKGKFRKSNVHELFASNAREYMLSFEKFEKSVLANDPDNKRVAEVIGRAKEIIFKNHVAIERYSSFLTHADCAPHNLRVSVKDIYLLDYTSMHFGNKYEGWARFLNFMVIFNQPLEIALVDYVRQNRGEEEYLVLRLMRMYKICFLLKYYTEALTKTSGDLHEIARLGVEFWTDALQSIIDNEVLPEEKIRLFNQKRELLRSEEEKKRQKEIGHSASRFFYKEGGKSSR